MKQIPLTQGKLTLVDDEDYKFLRIKSWAFDRAYGYAVGYDPITKNTIKLSVFLMGRNVGFVVDHINGDKLDNRRANLRVCTQAQNMMNRKIPKNNKSGYKGVSWDKEKNKWRVQVCKNRKITVIGYFTCLIKAAKAYDRKSKELFGEYSKLNFPVKAYNHGQDTKQNSIPHNQQAPPRVSWPIRWFVLGFNI